MSRTYYKRNITREPAEIERLAKVKKKLFQKDSGSGAIVFPLGPEDKNLIPPGELEFFNPKDDALEVPSTSTLQDNDFEILTVSEEIDEKEDDALEVPSTSTLQENDFEILTVSEEIDEKEDDALEVPSTSTLKDNDFEIQHVTEEIDEKEKETAKSRKRTRKPDQWQRNIKKRKRQAGEEYESSKGNIKPAKTIKITCETSCPYKCSSNFTTIQREEIKQNFYRLSDDQKSKYYDEYTLRINKDRTRTKKKEESRRIFSFQYYFLKDKQKQRVCKTFFCNTLDISVRRVYYFHMKKMNSHLNLTVTPGKGKHIKKQTPEEKIEEVKQHINSFPTVESHYCRASTSRQYLPAGLSVTKMYALYTEKYKEPVKENIYRKVFSENFNLGFHRPKKDVCDLCSEFKAQNNPNDELKEKYKIHLQRKKEGKEERDKDREYKKKENNDTAVITFDLENIFSLPKATVSCFFYTSKLTVYNLTAHCDVNKSATNAIWDETRNGRSGDDLASALIKNLKSIVAKLPDNITKLILWSDSCVPQNRNSHMSMALIKFLLSDDSKNISVITQKFSEPGHGNVQEVDGIHSLIERHLRHQDIYSPLSLLRAFLKIRSKSIQFSFIQMQDEDFFSYHTEAIKYGFHQIPYKQVKSLTYSKANLVEISYQTLFSDPPKIVNIQKSSIIINNEIILKGPKAALTKKKIDDIRSAYKYMPPEDISCMEAIIKKSGKKTNDTNKTGSDKANKDNAVRQKIKEIDNPSTANTSTKTNEAKQKTENKKENVTKKKTDQGKKKPSKKANKSVKKNEKSRAKRKKFF